MSQIYQTKHPLEKCCSKEKKVEGLWLAGSCMASSHQPRTACVHTSSIPKKNKIFMCKLWLFGFFAMLNSS